ncbi:MAG TPA: hypothetical protein VNN73_10620 [Blastocatellia bacterium]|nr:hypothetical protein [Blastocatellia bacterium]
MLLGKVFVSLLLSQLVSSPLAAQSPLSKQTTKSEEQAKVRQEIEKRALALVDEAIEGAKSLKLPENRIRIQLNAANLLWLRNEARARALFKEATEYIRELLGEIDPADPLQSVQLTVANWLRSEAIQMISQHDAKLALDFLRATRQPSHSAGRYYGSIDPEAQLEIRLAAQIANKDPEEALRMGEENLSKAFDHEVMNLLNKLQSIDKSVAARFQTAILNQLRNEDLVKNPSAGSVALWMLRSSLQSLRARATQTDTQAITEFQPQVSPGEDNLKELIGILLPLLLNNTQAASLQYRGYVINSRVYIGYSMDMLRQLQPFMAEIEKLAPMQATALCKAWAQFEKNNEAVNGPMGKIRELLQSGTLDELLESISKAPADMRDNLYQQAAWKAMNQGDTERAYQILNEKISDPMARNQMLLNLDRQKLTRAGERANLDEMRRLLPRLPSIEDRINVLIEFATSALEQKDRATALQLFSEAQLLMGNKAQSYSQLYAQIRLAQALRKIDPARGFAIIEALVAQFNELAAAAAVMNGFDVQYFKDGEMVVYGGNQLVQVLQQAARELGPLARGNFDRAAQIVEQLQLNEARLTACLALSESVLSTESSNEDSDDAETESNN